MACPTCDHTMQSIGQTKRQDSVFWCPRCGTIRTLYSPTKMDDDAPSLPHRVRAFLAELETGAYPKLDTIAHRIGLEESCTLPAERKLR